MTIPFAIAINISLQYFCFIKKVDRKGNSSRSATKSPNRNFKECCNEKTTIGKIIANLDSSPEFSIHCFVRDEILLSSKSINCLQRVSFSAVGMPRLAQRPARAMIASLYLKIIATSFFPSCKSRRVANSRIFSRRLTEKLRVISSSKEGAVKLLLDSTVVSSKRRQKFTYSMLALSSPIHWRTANILADGKTVD